MVTNELLLGAIFCTIFLLTIVFFILCYLIIQRRLEERMDRQIQHYIKETEEQWYNFLLYGREMNGLKQVKFTKYVREAIDKIFVSYVTTVSNAEVKENISKYAALNLQMHYKKMLTSKDWAIRVNVLRRATMFDLQFLAPIIEANLKQNKIQTMDEYLLALQIIAKSDTNLFIAHLYSPRLNMSEYEYKVVLSHIDETYTKQFIENFDELPMNMKLSLLDYLGMTSSTDENFLRFFESQLTSEYKEIRIRALKAISAFGMVTSFNHYRHFLKSSEWEERLMLAKVLRLIDGQEASRILEQLICDSHWNVRKQAALTLKSLKNGRVKLQSIVDKNEDRFAAEIAREVLR